MQVPKKNYIHLFKSKKSLIFARQKEIPRPKAL